MCEIYHTTITIKTSLQVTTGHKGYELRLMPVVLEIHIFNADSTSNRNMKFTQCRSFFT